MVRLKGGDACQTSALRVQMVVGPGPTKAMVGIIPAQFIIALFAPRCAAIIVLIQVSRL
jgi:hypothetical protein